MYLESVFHDDQSLGALPGDVFHHRFGQEALEPFGVFGVGRVLDGHEGVHGDVLGGHNDRFALLDHGLGLFQPALVRGVRQSLRLSDKVSRIKYQIY